MWDQGGTWQALLSHGEDLVLYLKGSGGWLRAHGKSSWGSLRRGPWLSEGHGVGAVELRSREAGDPGERDSRLAPGFLAGAWRGCGGIMKGRQEKEGAPGGDEFGQAGIHRSELGRV